MPNCSIRWKVLGKRVNRGGGFGLEIPVEYRLQGHAQAIEWCKKRINEKCKKDRKHVHKMVEINKNKGYDIILSLAEFSLGEGG